jgi:hypothetical protein
MTDLKRKQVEALIISRLARAGHVERIHLSRESEIESERFRAAFPDYPTDPANPAATPDAMVFLSVAALAEQLALLGLEVEFSPGDNGWEPHATRTTVFDPAMKALHVLPEDSNWLWEIFSQSVFRVR